MNQIFERQEATAALTDLLEAAFAGRGGAALVCGAVALGKSTLLDHFAGRAADAGAIALTATAAEAESGLPLGVLAQFMLGTALPAEDREELNALITQGARELAAEDAPGGAAARAGDERMSPTRARIADRFCTGLADLSARTPLAIVVDDVHHADPASLACLEYLVRRIRHARIVMVLAHADHTEHAGSAFRLDVLRQPHSRAFDLAPLTRTGVAAMLETGLGRSVGGRVAAECYMAGGGNPLLTDGLVRDQKEAVRTAESAAATAAVAAQGPYGSAADQSPYGAAAAVPGFGDANDTAAAAVREEPGAVVGDGYVRAVLACLRRASPLMLSAARGIAVLDGAGKLSRLLDLDSATAGAVLRDLDRVGLLEDNRFRHPAARAAVLADLPAPLRAHLHETAAEIAHADGRPAAEVAEHLLAAHRAEAPWAVPALEEAARIALTDGMVTAAIGYLRLAHEACTDVMARPRLTTMLVRAEWRLNPSVPAQYLDELMAAMREQHLASGDAMVLARALLWHGRTKDAADVLKQLSDDGLQSGPENAADLRATRAWLRASFAPLLEFAPENEAGAEHRPTAGTTELRHRLGASAALDEVLTRGPSAQVVEEAERILRGARLETMGMDAVESALLALTYGEHPHRAAPWCDKLIEAAIKRESPSRQARLSAIRSEISVRQGDLLGGERHARLGLDIIPATGWGVTVGACLGSLLTALTEMGRHDEAAEALSRPVPDAMLESRYGLHYIRARGRFHLATEDPDSALADFLYCGELMRRWEVDAPGLLAWRSDAAEALLAIGARDRARRLLEDQLERCDRRAYPRAHGNALRVLAASYELRQRPMLLRSAADALQESEDRYLLALTLCDLTTAYQELGESRRARVIGRQAWNIAQECHAEPVSRLLAADGAHSETEPAGSTAVLSEAEQRVADLVIQGHTNREIAKRLFITVSTVEQHLTHAYRKLGVSSRADLAMVGSSSARRAGAVIVGSAAAAR